MHRHPILTAIVPLLVIASADAVRRENGRSRGLGTSGHEHVSSEPLTFEIADPEPTDRERVLADGAVEHPYEVMGGMDLWEGEEEWTSVDGEEWDEDYDYDAFDGRSDVEGFDSNDIRRLGGDEEFFDSTYDSEDGFEFFEQDGGGDEAEEGEGSEEVGETDTNEPIANRLRRLDNPVMVGEEMDEERYLAEKESFRDDSIPIFEPTEDQNEEFDLTPYVDPQYREEMNLSVDQHDRDLQSGCTSNQQRIKIKIITDQAGWETAWKLTRNGQRLPVVSGPPVNRNYGDSKTYMGGMCLDAGSYKFSVIDKFADGMCGANTGRGLYRFYIDDSRRFSSPSDCSSRWAKRDHSFTIRGSNNNNNNNNNSNANCFNVRITFKVDNYGEETVVRLTGGGTTHLESNRDVEANQVRTMRKCVPSGTYTLRLIDPDGICCSRGQGYYKLFVNNQRVIGGAYFLDSKTHTIRIGSNWQSRMSARAREWLAAHNDRRRLYNGSRGYVAMRWSSTLERDAKYYAEQLANNCGGKLVHAKGINDGENLAKNEGSGSWANQYAAEKIMGRWVDKELTLPYPDNAHYTQVVWRATQYVGCGEASRNTGNGMTCRIQVCRYTRAGNCNVRNRNWRAEAWKDDTGCGRPCPSEGCFI